MKLLTYVKHMLQPLVPAVCAEDGQWIVHKPFMPVCKPGGHGVIWKLAYDKGVFKWFYDHGRKGATVRQVRSPLVSQCTLGTVELAFLLRKYITWSLENLVSNELLACLPVMSLLPLM